MAVTKGNGFPARAQPTHCRSVSVLRFVPWYAAHPPPWSCLFGILSPFRVATNSVGDCLDLPINCRTCGQLAAERMSGHGESSSL
jgi:hypothetical protein